MYSIIPVDIVITELQSNGQRARGKQASNFNKLFTENAVSLYGKTTDSCYIPCCMVRLQTAVTDNHYIPCGELCGKTTDSCYIPCGELNLLNGLKTLHVSYAYLKTLHVS